MSERIQKKETHAGQISENERELPKQTEAEDSHLPLFLSPLQDAAEKRRFFEFHSSPGDFTSQTGAAPSDRMCPRGRRPARRSSQLAAWRPPLAPLPHPRPGLLGRLARSLPPPGALPTPAGPTCQNRGQAVGCQPRAVISNQNRKSQGAEDLAGDRLVWPFCA